MKKEKGTPLWKALLLEHRLPWKYKHMIYFFSAFDLNLRNYYFYKEWVRQGWNNKYLTRMSNILFNKIVETPSFKCNQNSDVEIHSLICKQDLNMYLLAIKSFLRFYNNVRVIVHDDGSLTREDIVVLKKHILGIKIINKKSADEVVNKFLNNYPYCRSFRKFRLSSIQVFDYNILSERKKLISFDSDILFLRKPDEIINWIKKKNTEIIYNHENMNIISGTVLLKENIACLGDVNGGFVCYYKNIFNYDKIEQILKRLKNKKRGWELAQTHYDYAIFNSSYTPKKLSYKKYYVLNRKEIFPKNPIFVHFLSNYRFDNFSYARLGKKIIAELRQETKK